MVANYFFLSLNLITNTQQKKSSFALQKNPSHSNNNNKEGEQKSDMEN